MRLDPDSVRRWLAAEARAPEEDPGADRAGEAEKALLRLFQALPSPAPSPGFADRVLARAGVAVTAATTAVGRPLSRVWGWAVSVSVVLVGLSSLVWLPVAWELLGQLGWWAPVELLGDGIRALTEAVHRGFAFWELASRVSAACALAVSRPSVAASLAGAVLVAVLAFRLLLELTSARDRSWTHV
jgi:hypothetical protein